MKKSVKKGIVKEPEKPVKKIKIIKPLAVEVIKGEKEFISSDIKEKNEIMAKAEKAVVLTIVPLPADHVRCIVLKEHPGMTEIHKEGDIVDLPDRRYKSLSFRGMVQKYEGGRQPNRRR